MISTYTELKNAVASWLHRGDTAVIAPDLIMLGEWKCYRLLRIRAMEASLSGTTSGGVLALPADYVNLKFAYVNRTPKVILERRPAEWIHATYPTRTGVPQFIGRDQGNFVFGPTPDSNYDIAGTYYKRLPPLSDATPTNWLTANAPDLLLFGALSEAAAYFKNDGRIPTWQSKFEEILAQVQGEDDRESISGGPLTMMVR